MMAARIAAGVLSLGSVVMTTRSLKAIGYGIVWIAAEHVVYLMEAAGRMKRSAVGLFAQQAIAVVGVAIIYFTAVTRTPFAIGAIALLSSLLLALAFGTLLWRKAVWP